MSRRRASASKKHRKAAAEEQKRSRRLYLYKLQGGRCWICLKPLNLKAPKDTPLSVTRDHLIPKAHGGKGLRDNVLLAHKACNVRRAHFNPVNKQEALQRMRPAVTRTSPRA